MCIVSCIENNWETLIGVNLKTNYGKKDIYASKGCVKPTNTFCAGGKYALLLDFDMRKSSKFEIGSSMGPIRQGPTTQHPPRPRGAQ
jgi:hypothetical protein